jgi:ABC-type multidrug transport system fused ATPase/permease subunit
MTARPSLRRSLHTAAWMVRLCFRADPWRTAVALIPVSPICFGAVAVAARMLVNGVVANHASRVETAGVIAGIALFLGFASTYLQFAATLLRLREAIGLEIDRELLEVSAAIPTLDHFHSTEFADRVELLRTGRAPLTMAGGLLTQVIFGFTSVAISAALLGSVTRVLAVLAVLPVGLAWWYRRTERKLSEAEVATASHRREALHLFDVGTGFAEGKELRVFQLEKRLLARYRRTWRSVDHGLNGAARGVLTSRVVAWSLYCAVMGLGLAYAIDEGVHGHITPGNAFLVVWVMIGQGDQGANLARLGSEIEKTLSLGDHFLSLREDALERARAAVRDVVVPTPLRLAKGISMEGVSFSYPNATRPALEGVSLRLAAGTAVVLIGENGAGKTTLVNLLLGLIQPTAGEIVIEGVPLSAFDSHEWFTRTAVVCQDSAHFELLAWESVGVGYLPDLQDRGRIQAAVIRAGAEPVVTDLPEGLDTQLGARFGGSDLSGGEWQRVAAARSMMRREPLLLVLDEPTASLDAVTERTLLTGLIEDAKKSARRRGMVTVMVSHRFATVQAADVIVVLDGGRVVEMGSHDELLARDGRYADGYQRQARAYRT